MYMTFPHKLKEVGWSLNLETSSSCLARQARPVAHLQLGLDRSVLQYQPINRAGNEEKVDFTTNHCLYAV